MVVLVLCVLLVPAPAVGAGEHRWQVLDQQGQPLPNAVVTLRDGVTAPPLPDSEPAIMRQRGQQFEPRLLLVPVGTLVSFPNEDATAHHVYSFSPTKPFELDLYKGDLHPPLRFDKAGVVVLGCNIHDAMRGVIYVTDAPSYARSDAQGMVTLPALPGEQQELTLWHPRQISAVPPVAWATGTPPPALIVAVNAPAAPVVRGLANWRKARAQAR